MQRQISDAQRLLIKPPASQQQQLPPQYAADTISLPDLQNHSISQSQPQQQPQYKLSQWRKGSASSANPTTATSSADSNPDTCAINNAPGSKPGIPQSSSPQNLSKFGHLCLGNLGGDPSWSNLSSTTALVSISSWPTTMESTVKDDYLSSLTKTSPSVTESPAWNQKSPQNSMSWSTNDSLAPTPTSFPNEQWEVLLQQTIGPTPGMTAKSAGYYTGVNRQHSLTGESSEFTGKIDLIRLHM